MSYSIVIPFIKIVHYEGLHRVGESRFGANKLIAHYTRNGKPNGKTVRNFIGEPNHYDRRGHVVGYSRKVKRGKMAHYDRNGYLVGFSRRIFGLVWIHSGRKTRYRFT